MFRKYLVVITFSILTLLTFMQCTCNNQTNLDKNSIRVMTFNIRYNNPGDGINAWTNRESEVVSMIKFYDADIIGTQEVLKEQKQYLDSALAEYQSVGVGRSDGKEAGEFSALYFRKTNYELLNSGTFWLSETPEVVASIGWDAALERISTWAELKRVGATASFFVFNTHFDHIGEQARINSAGLILNKISKIAGDKPVILTGDFNVSSENTAYKTITAKLSDTQFKSVSNHHGPTWTFHGFESVEQSERKKIDYIFANDKIEVLKHAVLSDKFDRGYPSDHLPVLAELKF